MMGNRKGNTRGAAVIVFVDYTVTTGIEARHIVERAVEAFGPEVTLEYKFLVRSGSSESTRISALAALAARDQGRLSEMHEALLDYGPINSEAEAVERAAALGLDLDRFRRMLGVKDNYAELELVAAMAAKAKVEAAPALLIDGARYEGPIDEFALREAIAASGPKPVSLAISGFFSWGASAAFALLAATIFALILVNVGYAEAYEHLRELSVGFDVGEGGYSLPLEVWVNDGLMAIFFLLIGLEIKREILYGELSDPKRAAMPIIGAIGGMLIPALIYAAINFGGEGAGGWGIPMATDIAFTLGLMALLGTGVPISLKVFISALAVADDLGAILVIALFYGHGFDLVYFLCAIGCVAALFAMNVRRIYLIAPYIVIGCLMWFFIHESGLHATLAGVITAAFIPSRPSGDLIGAASQSAIIFEREIEHTQHKEGRTPIRSNSLATLHQIVDRLQEPAYYLEHFLERWVNYLVLPLFAFVNTGILIAGSVFNLFDPVTLGIILGLCAGKPIGIVGLCWLASRTGLASLSDEISWGQLLGGASLAGVGFTMSLVVAGAAFEGPMLEGAKLSILIASTVSATLGLVILRMALARGHAPKPVAV
ncbi:MAG: Na+/H+ antiporter NhaA [Pseudomonadota bacterium]